MANNENLKPVRTKEEARERGRNGGKASGKKRRELKTMKLMLDYLLSKIQERMTTEIADCIMKELDAKGVMVICEGVHFCMRSRGIKKQDASMVTSAIRGEFVDNFALRAEFLSLIK